MKGPDFNKIAGFDWDSGNIDKNWEKHQVMFWESEEIFGNEPLLVQFDETHSVSEETRYYALGRTNQERFLFVAFTIRGDRLRVISARPMSQREKTIYQKQYEQK